MKTLLAITTYNQLKFTQKCINSLKEIKIPGLDIIFIDDVSTDGTVKFLKGVKMEVISRNDPKGLTWSWNIAYRKFKEENYDNLIISNNDVLFSQGALRILINSLKKHTLVCPLSTKKGAGHNWKEQAITQYYPSLKKISRNHSHYKLTQENLQKEVKHSRCKSIGRF